MPVPANPKIYHIVHVDRLPSIVADGNLWCDAIVAESGMPGTTIGMNRIKNRRLNELLLSSHDGLFVGDCVPFYFCPRSVMLYVIQQMDNAELAYSDGQRPIVHLEADLLQTVAWAERHKRRWAFTSSNAGSYYFEDYADLGNLVNIDWDAVQARYWTECKESKQAEFLLEHAFPWQLVHRIGVYSWVIAQIARKAVQDSHHRPHVEIRNDWYY